MSSFGIISEGYTDQLLLEGILEGFFKGSEDAPQVKFLSPPLDETDAAQAQKAGWYQVFEYCKYKENIERDLQFNDYLVIQIDTDVSEESHYDVKKKVDGVELTPIELVTGVIQKFQLLMSNEVFNEYADKLIFAISVHSIECWLLPEFGKTSSDKKKTVNCIGTVNKCIGPKLGFTIDPNNKSHGDYYEKFAQHFADKKRSVLISLAKNNPSFDIFLSRLSECFPDPVHP